MPWKVSDPVSERLVLVKRWMDGERVVDLCREFGISRKTAYRMRARYEEFGARGLFDRGRALTRGHVFHLSVVLAGQHVGVREVEAGRWLISFMQFDLGHYDCQTRVFEPKRVEWKEPSTVTLSSESQRQVSPMCLL